MINATSNVAASRTTLTPLPASDVLAMSLSLGDFAHHHAIGIFHGSTASDLMQINRTPPRSGKRRPRALDLDQARAAIGGYREISIAETD
jgi:hypothetical protein